MRTIDVTRSRFRDAPFFISAEQIEVYVGGAGGISSWLALYLSRIVKAIHIADYDSVEEVNLAGQFYSREMIGSNKAVAMFKTLKNFGSAEIWAYNEKITDKTTIEENFVFAGFDNMEARKTLFEIWAARESRELFVEARLLADQYEVYFVQKGQEDRYRETLFDDSEAEDGACTFKQTSHFAAICAARMVHGFTNYLSGHVFHNLPFKVAEIGPLFNFETEE